MCGNAAENLLSLENEFTVVFDDTPMKDKINNFTKVTFFHLMAALFFMLYTWYITNMLIMYIEKGNLQFNLRIHFYTLDNDTLDRIHTKRSLHGLEERLQQPIVLSTYMGMWALGYTEDFKTRGNVRDRHSHMESYPVHHDYLYKFL